MATTGPVLAKLSHHGAYIVHVHYLVSQMISYVFRVMLIIEMECVSFLVQVGAESFESVYNCVIASLSSKGRPKGAKT